MQWDGIVLCSCGGKKPLAKGEGPGQIKKTVIDFPVPDDESDMPNMFQARDAPFLPLPLSRLCWAHTTPTVPHSSPPTCSTLNDALAIAPAMAAMMGGFSVIDNILYLSIKGEGSQD